MERLCLISLKSITPSHIMHNDSRGPLPNGNYSVCVASVAPDKEYGGMTIGRGIISKPVYCRTGYLLVSLTNLPAEVVSGVSSIVIFLSNNGIYYQLNSYSPIYPYAKDCHQIIYRSALSSPIFSKEILVSSIRNGILGSRDVLNGKNLFGGYNEIFNGAPTLYRIV